FEPPDHWIVVAGRRSLIGVVVDFRSDRSKSAAHEDPVNSIVLMHPDVIHVVRERSDVSGDSAKPFPLRGGVGGQGSGTGETVKGQDPGVRVSRFIPDVPEAGVLE